MTEKRKQMVRVMPIQAGVKERWAALREAVNTAAKQFTGKDEFALSIMYLHDVIGANDAMDRALADVRKSVPDVPLHGAFVLTQHGPAIEVSWWT